MALTSLEKVLVSVFCLVLTCVHISFGCSPIPGAKPPSLEERFYYSDFVAYGKIIGRYEEAKPIYDSVYTAEMEVYCTFKGRPLSQKINISDAGIVPGMCHSTNLTTGEIYTVFLDFDNNKFTPTFKEDETDEQQLDEITLICEHDINYAIGITEATAVTTCPENIPDYEGCLTYTESPTSGKEIQVKPLTNAPPAVVADNPKQSIDADGGNGSDVMSVARVLSCVCLLLYSMFV